VTSSVTSGRLIMPDVLLQAPFLEQSVTQLDPI
jgi:hypothetical protein